MDANKLKKLKEIGYVIPETCDTCLHAEIKPGQDFGECGLITYDHLKHTKPVHELSIYRGGNCIGKGFYELDPEAAKRLGDWAQFLEKRRFSRSNRHKQKTSY